jgi:enamine deaminase RidA (YjgF/YER057c/UK114 family)
MAEIQLLNPASMGAPLGQYSQIARVKGGGDTLYIAGQLATNQAGEIVGAGDFEAQCRQVYANVETALKSQGAGWANVVQFTTFLVHSQDIARLKAYRTREFPALFPSNVYPPNTLLVIDRLVGEPFLIEVQTVAVL